MFDSLHEECGVFGVFENQTTTVAQTAYLALFALQHRGQESCGIAVNDDGVFRHHRGDGLVPDVFSKEQLPWVQVIWPSVMCATPPPAAKTPTIFSLWSFAILRVIWRWHITAIW